MRFFILLFLALFVGNFTFGAACGGVFFAQKLPLQTGSYSGYLQLNSVSRLPLHLTVEKDAASHTVLIIHNADEQIVLTCTQKIKDTLVLPFPNFDSELRIVATEKKQLKGFWINFNRAGNYSIPFFAEKVAPFQPTKTTVSLAGKWETYFSAKTSQEEIALGIFEQVDNRVTGTVLTETGDYRFLEGRIEGNSFYLSCFDGTHAFLLSGSMIDNNIQGTFYSGKHYQTSWTGKRNDTFELRDPEKLTFLKDEKIPVSFSLKTLDGSDYSFPNAATKNKVVIIQIMGTWCPNCMDETNYYKELYDKYHSKGLEVISIGYEAAETFEAQAAKITMLKTRKKLDFTFLVGGKANKGLASEHFAALNEIISFPTSIFIGKDGEVKRIHTGFNGPGTGSYYSEYVTNTNAFVEELLGE